MKISNLVDRKDFYSGENDKRTKKRLLEVQECGMEEVGIAQFGVPGVMSGLFIEKVWSYNEEAWTDYMEWAKELINNSN